MTTPAQKHADMFDCEVAALIGRTDYLGEKFPEFQKAWKAVGDALNRARGPVRAMMSEQQRRATPN